MASETERRMSGGTVSRIGNCIFKRLLHEPFGSSCHVVQKLMLLNVYQLGLELLSSEWLLNNPSGSFQWVP